MSWTVIFSGLIFAIITTVLTLFIVMKVQK